MTGGLGQSLALLQKELAVASGRSSFWVFRFLVPGFLFLTMALAWTSAVGLRLEGSSERLPELGERMMLALTVFGSAAAVILVPAIALGAMEDERRSGALEVLIVSPLTEGQVLLGIMGRGLLASAGCLAAAAPLLAIPLYLGGEVTLAIPLRAAPPALLAVSLSLSFALWQAASGRSAARVSVDLVAFMVLPLGVGFLWSRLRGMLVGVIVLAGLFLRTLDPDLIRFFLSVLFPFYGLAVVAFADQVPWPTLVGSPALAVLASLYFFHQGRGSFSFWVKRSLPSRATEFVGRKAMAEGGGFRKVLASLRERWKDPGSAETEEEPERIPSLSRITLERMGGVRRLVYRLFRRNPFVFREVLARRRGSRLALISLAVMSMPYLLVVLVGLDHSLSPRSVMAVLGLLLCVPIACWEGSQVLPSRLQGGLLETLLSTPLRGWDIALGGAGAVLLGVYPILLTVLAFSLIPFSDFAPGFSIASTILLAAAVLLAYGTSLWAGLFLRRAAERVGASLAAALLVLAVPAVLLPDSSALSWTSPLRTWLGVGSGVPHLLTAAGASGGAALALIGAYALAFRKVAPLR